MMFSREKCSGDGSDPQSPVSPIQTFSGDEEEEAVTNSRASKAIAALKKGIFSPERFGELNSSDRLALKMTDLTIELGLLARYTGVKLPSGYSKVLTIGISEESDSDCSSADCWPAAPRKRIKRSKGHCKHGIRAYHRGKEECRDIGRRAAEPRQFVSEVSDVGDEDESDSDEWTEVDEPCASESPKSMSEADVNGFSETQGPDAPQMGQFLLPLITAENLQATQNDPSVIQHDDIMQILTSAILTKTQDCISDNKATLPTDKMNRRPSVKGDASTEDEASLLECICEEWGHVRGGCWAPCGELLQEMFSWWCEHVKLKDGILSYVSKMYDAREWSYSPHYACRCHLCLGCVLAPINVFIKDILLALANSGEHTIRDAVIIMKALKCHRAREVMDPTLWEIPPRFDLSDKGAQLIYEILLELAEESGMAKDIVYKVCTCRPQLQPLSRENAVTRLCTILENYKAASICPFRIEMKTLDQCVTISEKASCGLAAYLKTYQFKLNSRFNLHQCDCMTPKLLCVAQQEALFRMTFVTFLQSANYIKRKREYAGIPTPHHHINQEGPTAPALQQGTPAGTGAKPPDAGYFRRDEDPMSDDESNQSEVDSDEDCVSLGSLDSVSEVLSMAETAVDDDPAPDPREMTRIVKHLIRSISAIEKLMDRILKNCIGWPHDSTSHNVMSKEIHQDLADVDKKLMEIYEGLPEVHQKQMQVYQKHVKMAEVCMKCLGGSAPPPPSPGDPPPPASPPRKDFSLCPDYHLKRFTEVRRRVMHMRDQQLYNQRLRAWVSDQYKHKRRCQPDKFTMQDFGPRRLKRRSSAKLQELTAAAKQKIRSQLSPSVSHPRIFSFTSNMEKAEVELPKAFKLEPKPKVESVNGDSSDLTEDLLNKLAKINLKYKAAEKQIPESISPPLQEVSPVTESVPVYTPKPSQRLLNVNKILGKTGQWESPYDVPNKPEIPDMHNLMKTRRTPLLVENIVCKRLQQILESSNSPNLNKVVSFGIQMKKAIADCKTLAGQYETDPSDDNTEIVANNKVLPVARVAPIPKPAPIANDTAVQEVAPSAPRKPDEASDEEAEAFEAFQLQQITEVMINLANRAMEYINNMEFSETPKNLEQARANLEYIKNLPQRLRSMKGIAARLTEYAANASKEISIFVSALEELPETDDESLLTPETRKQIQDLKLKRRSVKGMKNKRKLIRSINELNTSIDENIHTAISLGIHEDSIRRMAQSKKDLDELWTRNEKQNSKVFKEVLLSITGEVIINSVFDQLKEKIYPDLAQCFDEFFVLIEDNEGSTEVARPDCYSVFASSIKKSLDMSELCENGRFAVWQKCVNIHKAPPDAYERGEKMIRSTTPTGPPPPQKVQAQKKHPHFDSRPQGQPRTPARAQAQARARHRAQCQQNLALMRSQVQAHTHAQLTEAEIVAGKGLSKIINESNKANEPENHKFKKIQEIRVDDRIVTVSRGIIDSKSEKSFKTHLIQGLTVPDKYKKFMPEMCECVDVGFGDEGGPNERKVAIDKSTSDNPQEQCFRKVPSLIAKFAEKQMNKAGQEGCSGEVCDNKQAKVVGNREAGEKERPAAPAAITAAPKTQVKGKPMKSCENSQHVCKVVHAQGSCPGGGSHHSSNAQDQQCQCCYCNVFGQAPQNTIPVSRNYTQTRERLLYRLNKKRQQQADKDRMAEKEQELITEAQTQPNSPKTKVPAKINRKQQPKTNAPKCNHQNQTRVGRAEANDRQQTQLAEKMAKMAVSDTPKEVQVKQQQQLTPQQQQMIQQHRLQQMQKAQMRPQLRPGQSLLQHPVQPGPVRAPLPKGQVRAQAQQMRPQAQMRQGAPAQVRQQCPQQQTTQDPNRQRVMTQAPHPPQQLSDPKKQAQQQRPPEPPSQQQKPLTQQQKAEEQAKQSRLSRLVKASNRDIDSELIMERPPDTRDLNALLQYIEGPARHIDKGKKKAKKQRQKAKKMEASLIEQHTAVMMKLTITQHMTQQMRACHAELVRRLDAPKQKLAQLQPSKKKGKKQKQTTSQRTMVLMTKEQLGELNKGLEASSKEIEAAEAKIAYFNNILKDLEEKISEVQKIRGPHEGAEPPDEADLEYQQIRTQLLDEQDKIQRHLEQQRKKYQIEIPPTPPMAGATLEPTGSGMIRVRRVNQLGTPQLEEHSVEVEPPRKQQEQKKNTWDDVLQQINDLAADNVAKEKKKKEAAKAEPKAVKQATQAVSEPEQQLSKKQRRLLAKQQAEAEEQKRRAEEEKKLKREKCQQPGAKQAKQEVNKKDPAKKVVEPAKFEKKKPDQKKGKDKPAPPVVSSKKSQTTTQPAAAVKSNNKKKAPIVEKSTMTSAHPEMLEIVGKQVNPNSCSLLESKPASCSIMEQLSSGVQVADLKLPPGITLTRVQPNEKKEAPVIKSVPAWKSNCLAAAPTPVAQPPPFINAEPSLMTFSTAHPEPPKTILMPEPVSVPMIGKSKKAKKKAKKAAEQEQAQKPEGTKMITLRNPMFHPNLPPVQVTTNQQKKEPIRNIPDPIPMPPNACQATITPISNGMYTIRNPYMSMMHQQAIGMPNQGHYTPTPQYGPGYQNPNNFTQFETKDEHPRLNLAAFTQKNEDGYSLFQSDDKCYKNDNFFVVETKNKAQVSPNPIGTRPNKDGSDSLFAHSLDSAKSVENKNEFVGGFYTPFGVEDKFRSALFSDKNDNIQNRVADEITNGDSLPYFQRLRVGAKLNNEVTIHHVNESKLYNKLSDTVEVTVTPKSDDQQQFARPFPNKSWTAGYVTPSPSNSTSSVSSNQFMKSSNSSVYDSVSNSSSNSPQAEVKDEDQGFGAIGQTRNGVKAQQFYPDGLHTSVFGGERNMASDADVTSERENELKGFEFYFDAPTTTLNYN